jgi:hypothetical protein
MNRAIWRKVPAAGPKVLSGNGLSGPHLVWFAPPEWMMGTDRFPGTGQPQIDGDNGFTHSVRP